MDGKTLARFSAVTFVGVAITVTVIELTRKDDTPEVRTFSRDRSGTADPLRITLRRCRDMGEAASRDPACLKVWAENRDRFLGQSTAPSGTPAPAGPAPVETSAEPTFVEDPTAGQNAPAHDGSPVIQPQPIHPGAH